MSDQPFDFAPMRSAAQGLSDYDLDVHIAVAAARRNVAAAHGYAKTADEWQDMLLACDDVRRERKALSDAAEDAVLGISDATDLGMVHES